PASTKLRLVLVGGLDGDERSSRAVLDAVRWMKRTAPAAIRGRWIVSALPMADPDGRSRTRPFAFPAVKGFYEDPEQPESRYVWRWVSYQAPDLVIEFRGDSTGSEAADTLTAALRDAGPAGLGRTATSTLAVAATHDDFAQALSRVSERSPLHAAIAGRVARKPIDIASTLTGRYQPAPSNSYTQ